MAYEGTGLADKVLQDKLTTQSSAFSDFLTNTPFQLGYQSGEIYPMNLIGQTGSSTRSIAADTIYCIPALVRFDVSISEIYFDFGGSAPSDNFKMGLYNWTNGKAGTLYKDFGAFSYTTRNNSVSDTINAGFYLAAILSDNSKTIQYQTALPIPTLLPTDGGSSLGSNQATILVYSGNTYASGLVDLSSSNPSSVISLEMYGVGFTVT